jgi:hypothetical protein
MIHRAASKSTDDDVVLIKTVLILRSLPYDVVRRHMHSECTLGQIMQSIQWRSPLIYLEKSFTLTDILLAGQKPRTAALMLFAGRLHSRNPATEKKKQSFVDRQKLLSFLRKADAELKLVSRYHHCPLTLRIILRKNFLNPFPACNK